MTKNGKRTMQKSEKEQKKKDWINGKVKNRMKQMKTTVALNIGKMYKLH